MQRYKVWNNEVKEFVDSPVVSFYPDGSVKVVQQQSEAHIPNCRIFDWAECYDKNNIPIYEGDILRLEIGEDEYEYFLVSKGEGKFNDSHYLYRGFFVEQYINGDMAQLNERLMIAMDNPKNIYPISRSAEVVGDIMTQPQFFNPSLNSKFKFKR